MRWYTHPVRSLLVLAALLVACGMPESPPSLPPIEPPPLPQVFPSAAPAPTVEPGERSSLRRLSELIPMPRDVTPASGVFTLQPETEIYVDPTSDELLQLGRYLAERLAPATGFPLAVREGEGPPGSLLLTTAGADPALGEEGYELTITPWQVTLRAPRPAGIFYGIQTIRQLLPPAIERATAQPGAWELPAATIRDAPRFAWRGMMIDVARHFFGVEEIKRYVDLIAYYKLNRLHLHLSDDQGWRLMIESWPNLALHGGSTEVGGGPGGFYTQAEYAEIVAYAQSRYVTVVPEIDMPGHTTAALASYPELNCDGQAPPLYTGWTIGTSALCVELEVTYTFVDDVIRELAALTPGPYIHIGGDEVEALSDEQYSGFIERVQGIVRSHGKTMVGWEEIAKAELDPSTVVQHWQTDLAVRAAEQGAKLIMSPSSRAYLDMKYTPDAPVGLTWAGLIEVQHAYEWDPATQLDGVGEAQVLGVEAPLWAETAETREHLDYLAFPRLPGFAEIGWSPAEGRSWDEYRVRLGAHGQRLAAMGVGFYRSPQVPWK